MSNSRKQKGIKPSPALESWETPSYPFAALVGQDEMKLALILNVVSPNIGGVIIFGHRGTGKSTAVRALADLLHAVWRVKGCPFNCNPDAAREMCDDCNGRLEIEGDLPRERACIRVVDLPLGSTEDRICGTLEANESGGC